MKLVWTASARRDIGEIVTYLWFANPAAAKRVGKWIEKSAGYLNSQPLMDRVGAIHGTRVAFAHRSYRIVYQVIEETVFILRVVHTSRQWPPVEDDH